jgi:hypothetical protein
MRQIESRQRERVVSGRMMYLLLRSLSSNEYNCRGVENNG